MAIGLFRSFRRIFTAFFGLLFGVEALPIHDCGDVDFHTRSYVTEQQQQQAFDSNTRFLVCVTVMIQNPADGFCADRAAPHGGGGSAGSARFFDTSG